MESRKPESDAAHANRTSIERRAYERFEQRGGAHGADVEDWLEAERELTNTASGASPGPVPIAGISNRESAVAENQERQRLAPPESETSESEEAGELAATAETASAGREQQGSNKAGSRSRAQKQTGARYPERSAPASKKVGGAFGKEPRDAPGE
jgi:hypothetical protein